MAIATGITNPASSHVRKYKSLPIFSGSSLFFTSNGGRMKPKATPSCGPNIPKAHAVDTFNEIMLSKNEVLWLQLVT